MPKSKKPRKKYVYRDPVQSLYSALILSGFSKHEAEAIARGTEPEPKTYQKFNRR